MRPMKMLLIHTCGEAGVVALADEAGVVAEEALPGRGTSEALMPALGRLFARTGWVPAELMAVGVVTGPGSFTGVRVGLSAAKGLCEAVGAGMVAMSRLGLLAGGGRIVSLLDAGRGEFFCGVYQDGRMVSEAMLGEAEARVLMESAVAVTCEARVAERMGVRLVAEPGAEALRAEVLLRVAAGDWSDVASVDANYLRRTDAEVKLEKDKG